MIKTRAEQQLEVQEYRDESRQAFFDMIGEAGLQFWSRPFDTPASFYGYVTDGTRICYVQQDRNIFTGWSVSSVHVPNKSVGTGYRIIEGRTTLRPEDLESGMNFRCPHWDVSNSQNVVKFKDWNHFNTRDNWNAKMIQMTEPVLKGIADA